MTKMLLVYQDKHILCVYLELHWKSWAELQLFSLAAHLCSSWEFCPAVGCCPRFPAASFRKNKLAQAGWVLGILLSSAIITQKSLDQEYFHTWIPLEINIRMPPSGNLRLFSKKEGKEDFFCLFAVPAKRIRCVCSQYESGKWHNKQLHGHVRTVIMTSQSGVLLRTWPFICNAVGNLLNGC